MMRTPKDKGGLPCAVLAAALTDLGPAAVADAYASRAMSEMEAV